MSSAPTGEPLAGSPRPTSEPLAGLPRPTSEPLAGLPNPTGEPPGPSGGNLVLPPARRIAWSGRSDLTAWLSLGLAVAATLATLPLIWTPIRLQQYRSVMHPDWYLYLIGAQVLTLPFFLLAGGLPRSLRGWFVFVIANAQIAALACLSALDLLNLAALHVLVLGLRVAVLSIWLFVLVGIPVVIWRLAARRPASLTQISTLGKLWFSALVFLLLAEPSAALLARVLDNPNRLTLPRNLPLPPPGELHVAFVGESTMAGFPYMKFGIPKVVGWQLEQMYPGRKIVLDDLSAVGLNLRTALARLNELSVQPQLLLLYSGHNEFFYDVEELATDLDTPWERFDGLLDWLPLFQLLDRRIPRQVGVQDLQAQGARALVDRPIASPEAREKRLARFGAQLEQLGDWCERLGISEIWFVPAGAEADYAPNRSYLDHLPTESERKEIESTEREARSLRDAGRWHEAGEKYRTALESYPGFAEFHFQLADCLMHEGKRNEAAPQYTRALELDGLPVRMIGPWRRKMAEEHRTLTVVDSDAVLRPHTPAGILDRSVFLDYVHPNLRSYYHLGMAAVERIRSDRLLDWLAGKPQTAAQTDFASAIAHAGFTPKDLALAYRRTAEADRWMTRLRFESSRLARDAKQYEDWSRQLESGQIAPGQNGTEALK
ncbi:MAG TPA: tetratricopeptide repeat protein [Planctomycetaceae bacterium]|jgi:tetratricopeptide (TPR) repeat protein|nr:tetratricopeptide repeat protein [Planctomycetaceae bacterium]